jgi:hypothetical protein
MSFQPVEWSPAAYCVAVQAGLALLVALMLMVPTALGSKKGFYQSYYQRQQDQKDYALLSDETESTLRIAEMEIGSHNFYWSISLIAALVAGGGSGAQTICVFQLPSMLALVFYFVKESVKGYAVAGSAFALMLCYFGFLPTPLFPPVVWQPAAVWVAFQSVLVVLTAMAFLTGKTDALYDAQPLTKLFMNRDREVLMGTQLLGAGLGGVAAFITNAAENYCLLIPLALFVTGAIHWIGSGDKKNAMTNWIIMLVFACFGLYPHMLQ